MGLGAGLGGGAWGFGRRLGVAEDNAGLSGERFARGGVRELKGGIVLTVFPEKTCNAVKIQRKKQSQYN